MEIVDIYNADGSLTGKTADREAPLKPGEYIMAVGMWVVTPEDKILLTKRSPQKKYAPNLWENTGGHVDAGESCLDAVIRELREETGLEASPEDILYLGDAGTVGRYLGKNYLVRMAVSPGQVRLQEGETCDARLVTYEEFQSMAAGGELAPSVVTHLEGYKEAFLKALGV